MGTLFLVEFSVDHPALQYTPRFQTCFFLAGVNNRQNQFHSFDDVMSFFYSNIVENKLVEIGQTGT